LKTLSNIFWRNKTVFEENKRDLKAYFTNEKITKVYEDAFKKTLDGEQAAILDVIKAKIDADTLDNMIIKVKKLGLNKSYKLQKKIHH
jgi:hypothetical protein